MLPWKQLPSSAPGHGQANEMILAVFKEITTAAADTIRVDGVRLQGVERTSEMFPVGAACIEI